LEEAPAHRGCSSPTSTTGFRRDAHRQAHLGEAAVAQAREAAGGKPLFDQLENTPLTLGNPTVTPGVGVTHLRYPVVA